MPGLVARPNTLDEIFCMTIIVRSLRPEDHSAWLPLWEHYLAYHGVWPDQAPPETWLRLMDPNEPVHGVGAFTGDRLDGIAHYIFHRHTWTARDVCFLSDVFTAREARAQGVGRALVEAVFALAEVAGAAHVYGTTLAGNAISRILYDKIAEPLNVVVYRKVF